MKLVGVGGGGVGGRGGGGVGGGGGGGRGGGRGGEVESCLVSKHGA